MLVAAAVLPAGLPAARAAAAAPAAPAVPAAEVWQPGGTRVEGAASPEDAPPLEPGRYTDSLEPGRTVYYRLELDGTSSDHLSVFGVPDPRATTSQGDGLRLELRTRSGRVCDAAEPVTGRRGAVHPVGDAVSRTIDPQRAAGDCTRAGTYLLSVARRQAASSDPAAWPLAIRYMSEPGLVEDARPGPQETEVGTTPEPPRAAAVERQGGTGFDSAALVGTGAYEGSLQPGETRFYRVALDWGQQLFADAEFAASPGGTGKAVPTGVGLRLYNTVRGRAVEETELYRGDLIGIGVRTVPVAYRNRFATSSAARPFGFAGWYYLAVTLRPDTVGTVGPDGTVDVTLRVQVRGERADGPGYAGDALDAGFGVAGDGGAGDGPDGPDGAAGAAGTDRTTMKVLAFGGIGVGTVLVLGLGLWSLLAARRPGPPPLPPDRASLPGRASVPGQASLPGPVFFPGPAPGGVSGPGPAAQGGGDGGTGGEPDGGTGSSGGPGSSGSPGSSGGTGSSGGW
ncbi:hypothetical protein GCM10010406_10070 [Streptomyces thermolineatus]|uniref:Uncharacterized protein n=1 Tax=Streptomyces thermolineatus TaxID=44033 RepID=A0ABN3L190_9ACTN